MPSKQFLRLSVTDSESLLWFGHYDLDGKRRRSGGEVEGYSNRFLAIDEDEVWDLGFPCGSCTILFRRVVAEAPPVPPSEISRRLNSGIHQLDDDLVRAVSKILPIGEYLVTLLRMDPRLVGPGDADDYFTHEFKSTRLHEHDPETPYYRGRTTKLPVQAGFGNWTLFVELAVPLSPVEATHESVVAEWQSKLEEGASPSVLAVTIPEWVSEHYNIEPGTQPDTHVVLTHFILDGHHKMMAAARNGTSLSVMAFINLESTPGEQWPAERIEKLLMSTTEADTA
jgi:hypothetical protein